MTDIVSVTLARADDTGPLEMISRERLERLQAIERAVAGVIDAAGGSILERAAAFDRLITMLRRK